MWVRSQDKTKLLKAEYVEYNTRKEQITKELTDKKEKPIYYLGRPAEEVVEEKIYHCIFINNLNCGTYSTKEKALKVLDMIGNHIEGLNKKYIAEDKGNPTSYEVLDNLYIPLQKGKANIIFQMPQDDEM